VTIGGSGDAGAARKTALEDQLNYLKTQKRKAHHDLRNEKRTSGFAML